MKKLLIFTLLIVFSFSQDDSSSRAKEVQSFVQGFGRFFNVSVSDEISKCFKTDQEVDYFWDLMRSTSTYSTSIKEGKFNGFIVSAIRGWAIGMKIDKTLKCVGDSKDFQTLLKALKLQDKKLTQICKLTMLFLDTYPRITSPTLETVSSNLERRNYEEAGTTLARGIKDLSKRSYNLKNMRVISFINGIFLRNEVPVPDTLRSECIENTESSTVQHILRFYQEWARSLKNAKSNEILRTTMKYFLEDGLKHYKETGIETWQCIKSSPDNEKFRKETKYNLDPYDIGFDFDFGNFLGSEKNVKRYVRIMKNIRCLLGKKVKFYLLAGVNYGTLLNEVSNQGVSPSLE